MKSDKLYSITANYMIDTAIFLRQTGISADTATGGGPSSGPYIVWFSTALDKDSVKYLLHAAPEGKAMAATLVRH